MKGNIEIRGARTHNLKSVDCTIPPRALTVVTGVSGSGKSSLVFDTLYAEGQRRFVQSMSTYSRLFLERMERPDVDFLSNVPPALALAQKNTIRNARSTVGTITEINDHLRLLFAGAGETRCPDCAGPVLRDDPQTGLQELEALASGQVVLVVAPIEVGDVPSADLLAGLLKNGYRRLWHEGALVRLQEDSELGDLPLAAERATPYLAGSDRRSRGRKKKKKAAVKNKTRAAGPTRILPVVVDRITVGKTRQARMREALEAAFAMAQGRVDLVCEAEAETRIIELDRRFSCRSCGRGMPDPTPQLFSFNSPLGACPTCEGFGRIAGIDLDKVIPDPRKTIEEDAIAIWSTPANRPLHRWLLRTAKAHGIPTDIPWEAMTAEQRAFVMEGETAKNKIARERYFGLNGFFAWLDRKRYKTHVRVLLARYRGYTPCGDCQGARLRKEALAVTIGGKNMADIAAMPIGEGLHWVSELRLDSRVSSRSTRLLDEVRSRFRYLVDVGLDYLTLARQARTLSGGEAQRIHLASALGAALTDTLYCLDEPTVGLHARDSERLLGVLGNLIEAGNTVVLVEHDPVLIEGASWLIDLGPGGGSEGGEVVFAGPPKKLRAGDSATGALLAARGRRSGRKPRPRARSHIAIRGARENNLADLHVKIPRDRLSCVTGVSGSGKSTLVEHILFQGYLRQRGLAAAPGEFDSLEGLEDFDELVLMTQAPVGRSSRSNPATYLKAWDEVRKIFAATPEAKAAGLKAGAFSFNAVGGRCEECSGIGTTTIEMHFMADLTVGCEACGGRRFRTHVLEMHYRGVAIDEVLRMTIDAACEFFADAPRLLARLAALRAVGLGYLTMGQPTATLSGGEAQRMKLASFLDTGGDGKRRLFLFDEPTTGLHLSDVARLVGVLHELVDQGNTVLVVEHNTDFIAEADWLIDLGPEGGAKGGRIVAEGPPAKIAAAGETATGKALAPLFPVAPRKKRAVSR
ncbi:MAG: excinuclease ABC subunit UvrA [Deltaproteobacteria bacterium]